MAEYKAIRGLTIRTIDGDASPLITGDIWYNSSSKKIRGVKLAAGAWASAANYPTARKMKTSLGTKTAALYIGGTQPPDSAVTAETFEYNGTAWTEGGDFPVAGDSGAGCGIQTAGFVVGWNPGSNFLDTTKEYNGTAWTEGGDYPAKCDGGMTGGTQTAAVYGGGGLGYPQTISNQSAEYDGSSWTVGNNMNTTRSERLGSSVGTQTAGMFVGGEAPGGIVDNVEHYDGTNWTEGGDINTGRRAGGGNGTTSLALVFGGIPFPSFALTESWDGSSWTEVADLSTGRSYTSGVGYSSGGNTSSLIAGGMDGGVGDNKEIQATEEWSQEVAAVTFTSS